MANNNHTSDPESSGFQTPQRLLSMRNTPTAAVYKLHKGVSRIPAVNCIITIICNTEKSTTGGRGEKRKAFLIIRYTILQRDLRQAVLTKHPKHTHELEGLCTEEQAEIASTQTSWNDQQLQNNIWLRLKPIAPDRFR